MNGIFLRRGAIFTALFVPGMSLVAWLTGGLVPPAPAPPRVTPSGVSPGGARAVVPIERGPGLGAGRQGRLESDGVALLDGRAVPYRQWNAQWATSEPQASREPGVSLLLLTDARVVVFPEPETGRDPVAREESPGTTLASGRQCLLRRREQAPPSAHLEGDAVARHVTADGQTMTLRSEVLDFRAEQRGARKAMVHVVESDRAVRMEGGGATIDGVGLLTELSKERPRARIEKDVTGTLQQKDGGDPVHLSCGGPAFLEAIDLPARSVRASARETTQTVQPWRATLRQDVRVEDHRGALTADEAVVEFVRTTAADRTAGAPDTVVRKLTATGHVTVERKDEGGKFRATSDRLRHFGEDVLTDVSVFEGSPTFEFDSGTDAKGPATSLWSVRCTGPATLRERRVRLADRVPDSVTITFEGDVAVLETDPATQALLGDLRAPRVTIEGRRGEGGKFVPLLARAESGTDDHAEFRRTDGSGKGLSARGKTIVWTERKAGADAHLALVGEPVVTFTDPQGVSPFGGTAQPGVFDLRSKDRIDLDFWPPKTSPESTGPHSPRTGPPSRVVVRGGLRLRKMAEEKEVWHLVSDEGTATFGPESELLEFRADGHARLESAEEAERSGSVAGERIRAVRSPDAAAGQTRGEDLDVTVFGAESAPALAILADPDGALRHEIRARTLLHSKGGAVVVASGNAQVDLRVPIPDAVPAPGARAPDPPLRIRASEIRADVNRADVDGEPGKASELRLLTATGGVAFEDSLHRLVAERAVYDAITGRAEAWGDPVRLLRHRGGEAPGAAAGGPGPNLGAGSFLESRHVRAFFDRSAKGAESFLRATCPEGGTLVAFHATADEAAKKGADRDAAGAMTRRRVTTTSTGPMELERDAASASGKVVAVWERELPGGRWQSVARIDAQRMEAKFAAPDGKRTRADLRSFVASGAPDEPARLQARNDNATRDVVALAERMECEPQRTRIHLSCPSGKSRVFVHDVASRRKSTCDSAEYDYETSEFTMERATEVE